MATSLPQRLSFVTIGARDVGALRDFYTGLGWTENPGSSDDFASFTAGSVRLALYPFELLGGEAARWSPVIAAGAWNGMTLAVNLGSPEEVDQVWHAAVVNGAVAVAEPVAREWGGYSGYIADPEGNRWEVAWGPGFPAGYPRLTTRIFVDDPAAQVAFLVDVFGAVERDVGGLPAEVELGESLVMVSETSEVREPFAAFLYVYVEDADATYAAALEAGATPVEEPLDTPYGDRRATVRDPFGNVFQIAHRLAQ